tara:strand:- start:3273 stop:3398 length:126 start_codon:yes stop_codon:yes gene_type:complete
MKLAEAVVLSPSAPIVFLLTTTVASEVELVELSGKAFFLSF